MLTIDGQDYYGATEARERLGVGRARLSQLCTGTPARPGKQREQPPVIRRIRLEGGTDWYYHKGDVDAQAAR